jgi:hypothetical protein
VSDILHSINFANTGSIPANLMKLPLPCAEKLWLAQTAAEWKNEVAQLQKLSSKPPSNSMASSLELLLSNGSGHLTSSKENVAGDLSKSDFPMNVMIHGLMSEVLEVKRSLPSALSEAIHLLKSSDVKAALNRWYTNFSCMKDTEKQDEMAVSGLITYHFAFVLLEVDLEEIKEAVASVLKYDSAVTSQSDEQGVGSLGKSDFVEIAQEAREHALEIIRLYLQEENTPQTPLFSTYPAYICAVILWEDVSNFEC